MGDAKVGRWNVGAWGAQALLGVTFAGTGVWKFVTPVAELGARFSWMGEVPPSALYATAALDLAGGLGVVLPSLTRVRPGLAVIAALGCATLQASAVVFHLARGEASKVGFNLFLIVLALFVAWARRARAPIAPR